MEQKQASSIEAEINELKQLLIDVGNNHISNFLNDADTEEIAGNLAYLILITQDKLTRLAKTYPLCRDNTLSDYPAVLRQNAAELKEKWICESITITKLCETVYTILDLSTKRCIQFETIVAYQSINDPSTALAVTMEQGVTAIDTIKKVLQRVLQFGSSSISSNERQLDLTAQENIQKIFELCEEIDETLDQLITNYPKSMVSEKEAMLVCVIKIARIMRDHQEQFEMSLCYLKDSLEVINDALVAIASRLMSIQWYIDQFTQQTKTPESEWEDCGPMVIDTEPSAVCASPKNLHWFKFFHSPKDAEPNGFHIFCENQTGYRHLAHFYLICKYWPVPSESTNLPENAINLILWWVLKFSTDEDKNRLYTGRTGGLSVNIEPTELLMLTNKEDPSSCCVPTNFSVIKYAS